MKELIRFDEETQRTFLKEVSGEGLSHASYVHFPPQGEGVTEGSRRMCHAHHLLKELRRGSGLTGDKAA